MSWTRRTLLGGLAGTCCCGGAAAQWPGGNQSSLTPLTPATRLGGCMIGNLAEVRYTLFGNSKEERFIENIFDYCFDYLGGTRGTLALFEGRDSYNAFATPEALVLRRAGGTVLIGRELIAFHKKSFGSRWGSALAASIAHEVGHLAQYRHGLSLPTRTAELHADYLAGFTIARFGLRREYEKISDLAVARQSLRLLQARIGDAAVHGTAEDRVRMFDAGADHANAHRARDELFDTPVDEGLELLREA